MPNSDATPQTQSFLRGGVLPIMGKRFEAARLRQAQLRVAVRRGKRAERTHASANREAKPNVINAGFQSTGRNAPRIYRKKTVSWL